MLHTITILTPHNLESMLVHTIGHLQQLRGLELGANCQLTPGHEKPFTSITSTELRKGVFSVSPMCVRATASTVKRSWASIDTHLCVLVDQLGRAGYRHTLRMEFRPYEDGYGRKHDLYKFLPKFGKRGVVTVADPDPDNCLIVKP